MGVPAAAEIYRKVGTFLADDSWAIETAKRIYISICLQPQCTYNAHIMRVKKCGIKRTCIPIHNLIRQLSVALHRPQFLPFFPLQWILCPCFRRAECSL